MPVSRDVDNARALARVLDTAVAIPGTKIRFGLDAVLGLIPGAGDAVSAALSSYIILAASRAGASRAVLLRMVANVLVDTVVGAIPLLGDLFDVAFRANTRNVALLERLTREPQRVERNSRLFAVLLVAILILLVVGVVTLGVLVARLVWRLLTSV